MCGRSGPTIEEQFKEFCDMLGPLVRSVTNFEGHVQTISNSVVLFTSRTKVEQIVSAFSAKMVAFETGASSAFSRDWPSLGQSGDSTATGSRDLKTGIQDADSTQTQALMMMMDYHSC